MRVRPARPVSKCVVCIRKISARYDGKDDNSRFGTGFLYRGKNNQIWLITNWHVLTGRRPDDKGQLLSGLGQSPHSIEIAYPSKRPGHFLPPVTYSLYSDCRPVWFEYELDKGIDLAGIPITVPDEADVFCIQDFCEISQASLEPGVDIVLIGFPFPHGSDLPYPLWKRAIIASEPSYLQFGNAQTLVDTPGVPGMSGSPVFICSTGYMIEREIAEDINSGECSSLDILARLHPKYLENTSVVISFLGVYAGATGQDNFDKLNLGRMYLGSFVALLVNNGQPGRNPFPPSDISP